MHGFNQGVLELKSLCYHKKYDIIFIQEHWITNDLLRNSDYFKNEYCVYSTSAIDSTQGIMRGRPHGGVATLVNKSICRIFSDVTCIISSY